MNYLDEIRKAAKNQIYANPAIKESFDILVDFYEDFIDVERRYEDYGGIELNTLAEYHSKYLNLHIVFQQTRLVVELLGNFPENYLVNMNLYKKIEDKCKRLPFIDENNQFSIGD